MAMLGNVGREWWLIKNKYLSMNKKWKICCKQKYIQANVYNVASKVKKG